MRARRSIPWLTANENGPPEHQIPPRARILRTDDKNTLEVLKARSAVCPFNDPAWRATDNHGNTIMHIVAMDCQVGTLSWLLDQSFAHDLKGMRNLERETPLEALEASLEEHRIKLRYRMLTVPISDKYDGVRHEELLCLLKLKGINPTSPLQVDRVRFGCTCGECIGGFLSPRVAFALECQGDEYDQVMDTECEDHQDGAAWCEYWEEQLGHVRPDVIVNTSTNKSYRQGFCSLFGYVAKCLRAKRVPTTTNVLDFVSECPPWLVTTSNEAVPSPLSSSPVMTLLWNKTRILATDSTST